MGWLSSEEMFSCLAVWSIMVPGSAGLIEMQCNAFSFMSYSMDMLCIDMLETTHLTNLCIHTCWHYGDFCT